MMLGYQQQSSNIFYWLFYNLTKTRLSLLQELKLSPVPKVQIRFLLVSVNLTRNNFVFVHVLPACEIDISISMYENCLKLF